MLTRSLMTGRGAPRAIYGLQSQLKVSYSWRMSEAQCCHQPTQSDVRLITSTLHSQRRLISSVSQRTRHDIYLSTLRVESALTTPLLSRLLSTNPGAPQNTTSTLSDAEFECVCGETLDSLAEQLEDMAEAEYTSDEYDVTYASGVITLKLGSDKGIYVINKQTPNKQIWLSSPTSGPKRYDYRSGTWVYRHDDSTLHDLLSTELSAIYDTQLDFTTCDHGTRH